MSRVIVPEQLVGIEEVLHVRLANVLTPGSTSADALVVYQTQSTGEWVDSALKVDVSDNYDRIGGVWARFGQNFGLAGEMFRVRRNATTNKYECVGSQGLARWGVADENIAKGSSGDISIWHSPTSASCSGEDSTVNVSACAVFGAINNGSILSVTYHPEMKNWIAGGGGGGGSRQGKLGNPVLNNATGVVTLWEQAGTSAPTPTATTETGINITGQTIASGIFVAVTNRSMFDLPTIDVTQTKPC